MDAEDGVGAMLGADDRPGRARGGAPGGPAAGRGAVGSVEPPARYFSVALGYAADGFFPARGGLSQESVALDNLDLLLHLNLKALPGLRGTSIRLHVQSNRGSAVTPR